MSNEITIRRGTLADAYSTFLIFEQTLADLLKRFGSTDGHKYINACLDVAAQSLREVEVAASTGG